MNPISILHLEDSPLDAELIRSRLVRGGIALRIDRAEDRARFLAAVASGRYDLILADYSLPDFDGLSALEAARRVAPETPFIFVSGMLGEEVAIETLKSGATDYVLKQRLERLVPAVLRALAESNERGQRRRAEAALRDGEDRHRLILDSIKDYAVITADTAGLIRSWSAGAGEVFRYAEADMIGRGIDVLFTPEDAAAGVPALGLEQARRGGRREEERWYVRRGGARFWGSGVVVTLRDESGALDGFTVVVQDTTGRKQAEDALRDADRRKDEFLAMLAHELRNPLSAIHNAVQLAGLPELPPDRVEWTREIIAHQVKHLGRLVDDLLDVSRFNRGKIALRTEPVDLSAAVRRAVETTRPFLEERRHRFELTLAPGPLRLTADPTRLEQMLVNLLTNAAKYTEDGGRIALDARREGDDLVVTVQDNGIGMTPEMIGRVFDLFAQADTSLDRTKGGLGIGLTIVHKLAELHGGSVTAASDGPGRGSAFRLRLPAAEVRGPAGRPGDPADGTRGPAPGRAARILVVDDNVATACSLSELLRFSGHEVATAYDGGEALRVAKQHRPRVVLLDIGLPTLDGYEVTRRLRSEETFKDALIIAITGYSEEQAVQRSREAGFDHHMVKPVDYEELLTLLTEALEARQAPR